MNVTPPSVSVSVSLTVRETPRAVSIKPNRETHPVLSIFMIGVTVSPLGSSPTYGRRAHDVPSKKTEAKKWGSGCWVTSTFRRQNRGLHFMSPPRRSVCCPYSSLRRHLLTPTVACARDLWKFSTAVPLSAARKRYIS